MTDMNTLEDALAEMDRAIEITRKAIRRLQIASWAMYVSFVFMAINLGWLIYRIYHK